MKFYIRKKSGEEEEEGVKMLLMVVGDAVSRRSFVITIWPAVNYSSDSIGSFFFFFFGPKE